MRLVNKIKIIIAMSCLMIIAISFWLLKTQDEATTFSVMTFNIENGGTQVNFDKVVEAVKNARADVVGLQEAWGNTGRLAKALGWRYYHPGQHILSRFPLMILPTDKRHYVFVEVKPGKVAAIANVHLPDDPYGPDLVKQGANSSDVIANGQRVRVPTIQPFVEKLALLAQKGMPVFLLGDFNAPSYLDWQINTVNKLPNHRYPVAWPVSIFIEGKGFTDSFRQVHPDPISQPGYTWPGGRPTLANAVDGFNPGKDALKERIDFIFSAGKARVLSCQIVGEDNKYASIVVNPWPSDHRALVSRFQIFPQVPPEKAVKVVSNDFSGRVNVSVHPAVVKSGQPFTIHWSNMPGNRFDYIRIAPVGSKKLAWGEAVRLYTFGENSGRIQYNAKNAKGNWLAWYVDSEEEWPLKPGVYNVTLILDDGFTEVANAKIIIK